MSDAPLTFGQMSVWRDIDRLPRARWHEANLSHTFTLGKPVSRRAMAAALAHVERKHESLRTVYDVTDPQRPTQRLLPPRASFDLDPVWGDDVAARTAELAAQAFDLNHDRPFRVLAVAAGPPPADQDEPNLTQIVLCVHHIACDGYSFGLLLMDLLALLKIDGDELPAAPSTLAEVAAEQRSASVWRGRTKATQKHFKTVFATPAATFRDRDAAFDVVQGAVESSQLAGAATALADRHRVSVATVVTAAFVDAVGRQCVPEPIRISLMTSNRFLERWRYQVTSMNQLVPVIATAGDVTDFGERLADAGLSSMRALRLGMFDVDQVTPAALGLDPATDVKPTCMFNIVEGAAQEYDDGDAPQAHWEPLFSVISAGCYLRVFNTTAGTMRLRLRTGGLPRETAAAILLDTYHRVLDAAG